MEGISLERRFFRKWREDTKLLFPISKRSLQDVGMRIEYVSSLKQKFQTRKLIAMWWLCFISDEVQTRAQNF